MGRRLRRSSQTPANSDDGQHRHEAQRVEYPDLEHGGVQRQQRHQRHRELGDLGADQRHRLPGPQLEEVRVGQHPVAGGLGRARCRLHRGARPDRHATSPSSWPPRRPAGGAGTGSGRPGTGSAATGPPSTPGQRSAAGALGEPWALTIRAGARTGGPAGWYPASIRTCAWKTSNRVRSRACTPAPALVRGQPRGQPVQLLGRGRGGRVGRDRLRRRRPAQAVRGVGQEPRGQLGLGRGGVVGVVGVVGQGERRVEQGQQADLGPGPLQPPRDLEGDHAAHGPARQPVRAVRLRRADPPGVLVGQRGQRRRRGRPVQPRRLQPGDGERASQLAGQRRVAEHRPAHRVDQEQRQLARPPAEPDQRARAAGVPGAALGVDAGRQLARGRVQEHLGHAHVGPQLGVDQVDQPHHLERAAAEVEEAVPRARRPAAEHRREAVRQHGLGEGGRRCHGWSGWSVRSGRAGGAGGQQGGAVGLAAVAERDGRHRGQLGRDHVAGQRPGQVRAQRRRVRRRGRRPRRSRRAGPRTRPRAAGPRPGRCAPRPPPGPRRGEPAARPRPRPARCAAR